jgi:hypothetical protein
MQEPIVELQQLLKRRRTLSQRVCADRLLAAVHDFLQDPGPANREALEQAVDDYADAKTPS